MSFRKGPFENSGIRCSKSQIYAIRRILLRWGRDNYRDFPWRSTKSSFHALLAEMLLQRTKAEQVAPVFQFLLKKYPTSEEASKEDPSKMLEILKPLGLRWRAHKIIELIRELDCKRGQIPETTESLLKLPGIGNYAASAYLTFHVNKRALIIDSNSVRLWSRVFGFKADGETRRKKWFIKLVDDMTPVVTHKEFNYSVLDHTRAVCKPRPRCEICPISSWCCHYYETSVDKTHVSHRN